MRKFIFAITSLVIFITTPAFAQQKLSPEGAGNKKYLDGYISKLKRLDPSKDAATFKSTLDNAKVALEKLKKSDPTYDVSDYESQIASFNTTASSAPALDENSYDFLRIKVLQYQKLYESEDKFRHSARGDNKPIPVDGTEYLLIAKEFDKQKVEGLVDKFLANNPNNNYILTFKKELADYNNYIKYSGILKHVQNLVEQAYEYKAQKNNIKAVETAEHALGYCKGVLLLSVDHSEAKQSLATAQKAYDAVAQSNYANLSSEFHKTHINRILFSKLPVKIGNETESDFSSEFKSDETIYATIYLSDKLVNLMNSSTQKKFMIEFSINDKPCYFYESNVTITTTNQLNSYLQFAIVPGETYDYVSDVTNKNNTILDFNSTIAARAPMTFKIGINAAVNKTGENIYGSFNYDLSGGHEKNDKIVNKIDQVKMEQARLPKANMTDAALVSKMTSLLNNNGGGGKYSLGRIVSTGWSINKNSIGAIIDRSISAYFLVTFPDGHCEYAAHTFSQEYSGGGSYSSKLTVIISPFDHGKILCENANK